MSDSSPKLGLPYIQPAQAQKHVTHNEAIEVLDAITQLVVSQFDATSPPALPVEGDTFALGSTPSGAWASNPNEIAFFSGGGWLFLPPIPGWRAWGQSEEELRIWDGSNWVSAIPSLDSVEMLGINSTADTTNRLSVSSDASLFNNAGAGHQIKVNKANAGDTASLLFQSGWAGHAEMGLAGDTSFSIKVSPDGGSWSTPLTLNPSSQSIQLAPAGTATVTATGSSLHVDTPITGSAIQSANTDDTSGRLMSVGAFGLGAPGASLGDINVTDNSIAPGFYQITGSTVGAPRTSGLQHMIHSRRSVSGGETQIVTIEDDGSIFVRSRGNGAWQAWQQVATSAHYTGDLTSLDSSPLFERGTNASGEYTRFADGTQFCWHEIPLTYIWARELYGAWNFPASFISAPKVFCNVEFYSLLTGAAPDVDAISTSTVEGASNIGAQFRLMRAAGQTDFISGDSVNVTTLAFGRWK